MQRTAVVTAVTKRTSFIKYGYALVGNRNYDDVNVNENNPNNHNDNMAFRGSLRVLETLCSFQPAAQHAANLRQLGL